MVRVLELVSLVDLSIFCKCLSMLAIFLISRLMCAQVVRSLTVLSGSWLILITSLSAFWMAGELGLDLVLDMEAQVGFERLAYRFSFLAFFSRGIQKSSWLTSSSSSAFICSPSCRGFLFEGVNIFADLLG